ncbi:helix-turn-helix transcriptional regulator [Sphingomonas sp.]|uniref:helix-turn-helix transcriptional regulator n=1 Tax=Sphingomonas sp. TaxID=28214 RepID=UPI0038ABED5B
MAEDAFALIGSIYDAVGEDDAVPHVMGNLSARLGATLAFWYVVRRGASGDAVRTPFLFEGGFGVREDTLREFREEMWRHDYALRAASVTDRTTETHELISTAELAKNDYAHWIRSSAGVDRRIGRSTDLGGGVVAGWAFHMPSGLKRRPRERAQFDILAPHVRNLFRLTSQFGEIRAQREGLEHVVNEQQHAVLLLAADGSICWASDAAHRLCSRNDGIAWASGKMTFARSAEKQGFDSLLQRVLKPDPSSGNGASKMAVSRPSGGFPYVIEVSRTPASFRRGVHGGATFIATLHDSDRSTDGCPEIWREMFGLTPMETRVAMLTMRGLSDQTIAAQLAIGVGTVRSHQKQLLAKTQTRSKAEAAHLLTRIN